MHTYTVLLMDRPRPFPRAHKREASGTKHSPKVCLKRAWARMNCYLLAETEMCRHVSGSSSTELTEFIKDAITIGLHSTIIRQWSLLSNIRRPMQSRGIARRLLFSSGKSVKGLLGLWPHTLNHGTKTQFMGFYLPGNHSWTTHQ